MVGGELDDVEVLGEEAGLDGEEGSMIPDAYSSIDSGSDSSRSFLMRARRLRVVSEVHSDVEMRSEAAGDRLLVEVSDESEGKGDILTSRSMAFRLLDVCQEYLGLMNALCLRLLDRST